MIAEPNTANLDKAGQEHWDQIWAQAASSSMANPDDKRLDNTYFLRLHECLDRILAGRKNLRILEVGCANSIWPYYFTKYHDAMVDGIDYSEIGCQKTETLWRKQGLKGRIYCADLFEPPEDILQSYDLVVSFGVVEHFQDTKTCIGACAAYLKPGGQIFSIVPNFSGFLGWLQKTVDKDIYNIHVPLSSIDLQNAHKGANLEVVESGYFMSFSLSVIASNKIKSEKLAALFQRMLSTVSRALWAFERALWRWPVSKTFSPYVYVFARR